MPEIPVLLEWVAVLSGLVYVFYAARNDLRCWYWGIISTACWAYVTAVVYSLYADGLLNVFYVVMGFIGLHQWKREGKGGEELPISGLTSFNLLWTLLLGAVISLAGAYFLSNFTDAMATLWDSSTTTFSIIATILLIRKKIENWPIWIVTNTAYIGLYIYREAWLFAGLFVIFTILAVFGWLEWRRLMKRKALRD